MNACLFAGRLCISVMAAGIFAPAAAQPGLDESVGRSAVGRWSVRPEATVEVPAPAAAAARLAQPAMLPSAEDTAQREIDVRLWVGSSRTAMGFGVGAQPSTAALNTGGGAPSTVGPLLLSLRSGLGDNTRLTVEHASYRATALDPARADVRMGIDFEPVQPLKRMGLSKDSLFRVQLRGSWNLSMRPRSGGVSVAIRAQL